MSDSVLEDLLRSADELVDQKEFRDDLRSADDLLCKLEAARAVPSVRKVCWKKRDSEGNLIFARPRSTRNDSNQAGCSRNTDPPVDAPDCDLVFAPAIAPETVEGFLRDLQQSLSDTTGDEVVAQTPSDSLLASTNWSTRKSFFSESWRAARPHLVNTVVAQANVGTHICQQCWSKTSVVRCRDCQPHPFFCADCDVSMHTRHPLHNRDATTAGYFQPLASTTHVVNMALCSCVRFVPVEIPDTICGCALSLKPGKTVTVITMNGKNVCLVS
ncbi:uncharacterized protein LOC117562758 isoform X2 [Gymnodraco acuticeps]|nr:uncharacterized protein LOC117562758 isoform X2 [Gymnodraco acuticeps]